MRILYFTRSDSVHDQRFMAALAESEHEAFVLRLYDGEYMTPQGVTPLDWKGIKGPLRLWQIPVLVRRLKKLLETLKPDLVHAGPLHDLAYLVAKTGYKPLLSMSWGFDLMRDVNVDAGMASRARFALAHSAALITDAQCSADKAVELGFDPDHICIFPWGVDIEKFSPQAVVAAGKRWREAQNLQDKTVLLCLRAMEPNYGVDVLAKAFALAASKAPDLRLLLLGDGSQRSSMKPALVIESILAVVCPMLSWACIMARRIFMLHPVMSMGPRFHSWKRWLVVCPRWFLIFLRTLNGFAMVRTAGYFRTMTLKPWRLSCSN